MAEAGPASGANDVNFDPDEWARMDFGERVRLSCQAFVRGGMGHPPGRCLYDVYRLWETADGHISYFAANDEEQNALFRAVGHPEWVEDPRFATIASRAQP